MDSAPQRPAWGDFDLVEDVGAQGGQRCSSAGAQERGRRKCHLCGRCALRYRHMNHDVKVRSGKDRQAKRDKARQSQDEIFG